MSAVPSRSDAIADLAAHGYRLGELVDQTADELIYAATANDRHPSLAEGTRVVVHLHADPLPSDRALALRRHAWAIARRFEHVDRLVPHLDLVEAGHDLALVTAVVDRAVSLAAWQRDEHTTAEIATVVASVAAAVHDLHREGLVHGNLRPESILIDPDGRASLLGASTVSDLRAELSHPVPLAAIDADPRYVSPERTGRTNRAIGPGSDLYSLGAILFELLTGSLPFTDTVRRDLIHAHIARRPPSVAEHRPGTPDLLCDVVDRLLDKDPERRYQTAAALAADLRQIADDLAAGRTPTFALRSAVADDELRLSNELFGRERELDELLAAHRRACGGATEIALVSGYSGVGKTRLVHELHRPVAAVDGWYCQGKFDLYRRDLPYVAFVEVAAALIDQALTLDHDELDALRSALRANLRDAAGAIGELIPQLAHLIGELPPAVALSPGETQARLESGIRALLGTLASAEHPLVVFVDDLQWSDLPSLRLIELIADDDELDHLMLVLAWRDNEVDAAHPAHGLLQRLRSRPAAMASTTVIDLQPMQLAHVEAFVTASLHLPADDVAELAKLLHDKTDGNPFFLRRLLVELRRDGAVAYDGETSAWRWDLDDVRRRAVSDNVADLVARSLDRLDPQARHVLQVAACIGPTFDFDTVRAIVPYAVEETVDALHAGLASGLLLPNDDDYRLASADGVANPTYAFLHDRVQEAAHRSLDDAEQSRVHLRIAARLAGTDSSDEVVDVASHLIAGFDALLASGDGADHHRYAAVLVRAAARAKSVMATESAGVFLDHADRLLGLLDGDRWERDPGLAHDLHVEAADLAYIEGRFGDVDPHADAVLAHTSDPLARMPIHNIRIGVGIARNEWAAATEYAVGVLRAEYDLDLPLHPSLATVGKELTRLRFELRKYDVDELAALPPMTDPLIDAAMTLLMKTATNAYWASPNLVPLIGFTMVRLSLRHGNGGLSAYGYVLYGLVVTNGLLDARTGERYGELAMRVLETTGARHLYGRTALVRFGFIRHGVAPMESVIDDLLDAFHEARAAGDIENTAYCTMAAYYTSVVSGEPLASIRARMQPFVDTVMASGHEQTIYGTSVWVQAVANLSDPHGTSVLSGEHIDFDATLDRLIADGEANAIPQGVCAAGFLAFVLGDDERAERYFDLLLKTARDAPGQAFVMPCLGLYAMLLARHGRSAGAAGQAKLAAIVALLKRKASANPADHRPFLDAIAAEKLARRGAAGASAAFVDAAAAAGESGFAYLEAIALERAADVEQAAGREESSRHLLGRAVSVWRRYGAAARLRQLGYEGGTGRTVDTETSIDLDTLLETAAAVSRELEVDAVVGRILELALRNAGARRAVLASVEGGRLTVVAAAVLHDDGRIDLDRAPAWGDDRWPRTVADYAQRTGGDLIVADATVDPLFDRDPYVRTNDVASLLVAVLRRGEEITGVLVLENDLGPDVFTERHLAIARSIVGQAVISMENAALYERQRAQAQAFARFVPRAFLERLDREEISDVRLGDAVSADLTILFSDLRDFTTLSESMSAAENFELLNRYLAEMEPQIQAAGGFIDKFIGDAVMALFTDGADGGVAAAVGMSQALAAFNRSHDGPSLRMGIGLHAGRTILGTIGSTSRMETTVIGDAVNVAARIEGMTKVYHANVLVTAAVLDQLKEPGRFRFREIGRARAKGKTVPITVHEVIDARWDDVDAVLVARPTFEAALTAWYEARFDDALAGFEEASAAAPSDRLAAEYVARARDRAEGPAPEAWDGVDHHTEK